MVYFLQTSSWCLYSKAISGVSKAKPPLDTTVVEVFSLPDNPECLVLVACFGNMRLFMKRFPFMLAKVEQRPKEFRVFGTIQRF